ncbi:uncharacterized protein LOC124648014 [Lolium rigidum]|uniref:uncharacterized protein LOC124648014 n=1 Tax=Lolium rigidum TaxID=89674 RepID=UPI001F5E22C5|nr:uncharacterized protein LOC124648014 [Lolium rigidum]
MHMAPVAHGALSARGALSSRRQRFLPFPDATAAVTVRFSTRRVGGRSRVVLCLAPGGGGGEREDPAGSPWDGRLVDEGMDTLRRRIRQVRAESDPDDYEDENEDDDCIDVDGLLPGEWTELERRHHASYVAGVREAGGVLLALLVRSRPGLGAGVLALVILGVPAAVLLVFAELITRTLDSISAAVLNGRM